MKQIGTIIALLLAGLMLAGCGGQPSGSNASVEDIYSEIIEFISDDLREAGFTDEDFEAEELPGYVVTDLKGDEAEWVLPDLNKDDVEEGYVIAAAMMLNSDQVIVLRAAEGKAQAVKEVLEAELAAQLDLWESYLADQAEKVQNTILTVQGDFIIYITYTDPEGIEEIFNNAM